VREEALIGILSVHTKGCGGLVGRNQSVKHSLFDDRGSNLGGNFFLFFVFFRIFLLHHKIIKKMKRKILFLEIYYYEFT
jgi:hypothetical protein